MTATRIVIVEFGPEVTAQDVADFEATLRRLASETANLVRMTCGRHYAAVSESALSAHAPGVAFGSFVSVWEFQDERALDDFLVQPRHRELAGKVFSRLVKKRYVANMKQDSV